MTASVYAIVRYSTPTSLNKVSSMRGDDNSRRQRVSLAWTHTPRGGLYDRLAVQLHHQDNDTKNYNFQTRTNTSTSCAAAAGTGSNCIIEQDFFFTQLSTGINVQLDRALGGGRGSLGHLLSAGLDAGRVSTEQMRDVRIWRISGPLVGTVPLSGGPGTAPPFKTLAGDTFPLRDFVPGETDSIGLFVQDEISGLMGGALTLTPALRYDWRRLKPQVDALAQVTLTNNGQQAVEQSDGALSPKLAALWQFAPAWSLWGHVAGGFRAPNYEEVNGSFRNTTQSYGVRPNPDLKPETSVGVEIGLRLSQPGLRGQVSVYDNRYKNFIESLRLNCPADPRCIAGLTNTNMSVNLRRVNIRGAEARAAWDMAPGWKLDGALAYARGDDKSSGQPLNSIEPLRYTLGLAHDAGAWGAELRVRGAGKKDRVNDFSGSTYTPWFRPPAYTVGDLSAWWQFHKTARITASIHNLTDEKYWLWSDIRQADARNPAGVDFYSQPGRSFNLALQAEF